MYAHKLVCTLTMEVMVRTFTHWCVHSTWKWWCVRSHTGVYAHHGSEGAYAHTLVCTLNMEVMVCTLTHWCVRSHTGVYAHHGSDGIQDNLAMQRQQHRSVHEDASLCACVQTHGMTYTNYIYTFEHNAHEDASLCVRAYTCITHTHLNMK